uniref:Uronyl 2-sulfotransferase n=1 Tax=Ornithorhynchus anatinus TaxID=9258 RepID=A0A6I8NUP4_ORNAN
MKQEQEQHGGGGRDSWVRRPSRPGSLPPTLRFTLRDYGFCMATLLAFCLGSLFYQLNGGPPPFLLDLRHYLGNSTYLDDHGPPPSKVLPFPSQVVYNRVGKCGSRTVVLLLRILSEKHGFNLVTSDIHNKTRLTKNEQMELIKNISTAEQPYLFTRHVHFLNFSRFGGDQPVYINIIRDPVNRFLSNYFFRRFGDWRGEQNHMIRTPSMRQEERYLDINECILENYPECSNPRLFYIIPYFCGQHPRCREPGEWALERAKLNVNENFLLVGILEELEDVLLLLERFLPHYFKDVLSIYKNPEKLSPIFFCSTHPLPHGILPSLNLLPEVHLLDILCSNHLTSIEICQLFNRIHKPGKESLNAPRPGPGSTFEATETMAYWKECHLEVRGPGF